MQKSHTTFGYNAMGLVFCCSVDDVKNSKRLFGFPMPAKVVTPAPPPPPLPILRSLDVFYDDLEGVTSSENQSKNSNLKKWTI